MDYKGYNDKITIGIPVYKNEPYLIERALLSALNQTYPHIEYIVVDDKGDSMDAVYKVIREHPRGSAVRVIEHERNRGVAAARNTMLEQATGTYFFTMDCDDTISPDCIAKLYDAICQYQVDFVSASYVREDLKGRRFGGYRYQTTLIEGKAEDYPVATYRYKERKEIAVSVWNKLYDLNFLHRNHIRCSEELTPLNEDAWFTYQVLLCAHSCLLLPDVTYCYLCNPESTTGDYAKGYPEHVARQYVQTQKLKSRYIASLSNKHLYRSLVTEIMKMSLCHSYRILDSSRLTPEVKRELVRSLLTLETDTPKQEAGVRTWRYGVLRLFFSLPMGLKMACVRGMVCLNMKQRVRRWIHF